MKINTREFKTWIAALDSGEYEQGCCTMQTGNKYCCLGVGCKVTIPEDKQRFYGSTTELFGAFPNDQTSAPDWLKKIDMDFYKKTNYRLSKLNDSGDFDFSAIATLLELVYIHKILD